MDNLIETLQKAQQAHGWLSRETLEKIANQTNTPIAKVMGVATFYAQFRLKPVGKYLILLCRGTACHVNGAAEIERAIADELGTIEGEVTPDGLFTYNNVACIGCCSLSPAMMVTHSDSGESKVYGKLSGKSAVEILRGLK
jgi:NADH-quinone oxidoreductase subunit E